MIANDRFDRILPDVLVDLGRTDPSTLIADVLTSTAAMSQRPRWRQPSWWLRSIGPAGAIARPGPWAPRLALLVGLVATALVGATLAQTFAPSPPIRRFTGVPSPVSDMATTRDRPALVALADGRALVAGGAIGDTAPIETYDPATRTFRVLGAASISGSGAAASLPDGTVLLVMFDPHTTAAFARVVDPGTGSIVASPTLTTASLDAPTLTSLADGRVLLTGGQVDADGAGVSPVAVADAEVYDPTTRTFTRTGSMAVPRIGHSATALADGRVLVVGGVGRSDAEIYDPRTGAFSSAGRASSIRGETLGSRMADGRILIFERAPDRASSGGAPVGSPSSVEIFDPATGSFAAAGTLERSPITATPLPDGRIFLTADWELLAGYNNSLHGWAGIFDPSTHSTSAASPTRAWGATSVALKDGDILFVGGSWVDARSGQTAVPWADLYR